MLAHTLCEFAVTMSSFFGFVIHEDKPALVKADPVAEINLTMACAVGEGNRRSVVSVRPDDGDTFTLAVLSPGVADFQRVDLKLTAGNEALEFTTSGATVHVTGYVTLPPEYTLDSESDSDSDYQVGTSTELARTRHGTARLVEADDSDSDDESFDPDLMFAESSDDEIGVQPLLKRAAPTPAPAAKQKKRKAADAAAATPVPKRQAKPDAVFEAAVVQFLKQNGSSPLSKVGNACKRPAGLSVKLKAFLRQRENLFHIDGDRVGLV